VTALLLLLLAASPVRAGDKASPETVREVEAFLKVPTSDLPPGRIDAFLAIDLDSLPAKLQVPFKAKRVELYTLKQLAEGKKKGTIRTPDANCDVPKDAKSGQAKVLLMAGYEEITDDELSCVMSRTKCSERELMCEFSLQEVIELVGKKKEKRYRFFFHTRDPIMAVVGGCRGGNGQQTNFFGRGAPICSH
jgi:hypothetical protein